ncbi:MAG TPA: hypothetical protein VGB45_11480 [Abditibacterium sp.]
MRGKTNRIYSDRENEIVGILYALFAASVAIFVTRFEWWQGFAASLVILFWGICSAVAKFRDVAKSASKRNESILIEAELLTAKSDNAESEGTIITYRFMSPRGQSKIEKSYVTGKPDRFSEGDKLVVLFATDGTHVLL